MARRTIGRIAQVGIFASVLMGSSCWAQHMNAKDAPCNKPSSGAAESACWLREWKSADAELNAYYKLVEAKLEPEDFARLKVAQRLWVQFRDANCAAEQSMYEGGNAFGMVGSSCLAAMTRQRTVELKVMYGWVLEK